MLLKKKNADSDAYKIESKITLILNVKISNISLTKTYSDNWHFDI